MTDDIDNTLMTGETWSDYQTLQQIEDRLHASLTELTDEQRLRYLQLCRIEPKARHELAEAIQRFKTGFEDTAYAELVERLRAKSGQTLDLHHTWLHTRMVELPEPGDAKDPIELLSGLARTRSRRALADNAPREHLISKTLWQAAKENFAFNLASTLASGQDFQQASTLTADHDAQSAPLGNLDVVGFIEVIRDYDFGARLHKAMASHLASTLNPLIFAHRKASLELDVLEAMRSRAIIGQQRRDSGRLLPALFDEKGLSWKFFHMHIGIPLLREANTIALPFCVMKLPQSDGVFSYFPNRPQGALRHHENAAQAIQSLREHIGTDAQANRIDWLLRTLSLADQARLLGELKTNPPDENKLNWLARQLYRAFDDQSPPASRLHLQAETDNQRPPAHSLLTAMEIRQGQVLAQDVLSIATSTTDKDLQQIAQALRHIGSEILELLTLPAPGGVTGLNRLMVTASLGTLGYNTISATQAFIDGQPAEFVQALGDIAELVISGRIQMVGARLSARRTRQLVKAIGKPHEAQLADGEQRVALDVSQLTSAELLQTMVRPDRPALSHQQAQYVLQVSQVERAQLEAAWNGKAPLPWTLAYATDDLQQLSEPGTDNPATLPLRQRFKQLPEGAALALLHQYPVLADITRLTPLEPEQHAAIQMAQTQSRLIKVFNTLHDPDRSSLGPDTEAVICNLMTLQPGWPADLRIEVYQGAQNFSGDLVKTGELLTRYGADSATRAVSLVRHNERYAGYDPVNDDVLQPRPAGYPLTSVLLRSLTDAQRSDLKYQIDEGHRLAQAIFSQAQIHSAMLPDLLPTPTTFDLSTVRLAAFQLSLDYSASKADRDGLYADDGKLYVQIEGDFFQVMHDADASSPSRKVMRIVRPGDPVASDVKNRYVASRPGRSEPITRTAAGQWVGAITGLSAGAPKTDRLKAVREKSQLEHHQYVLALIGFERATQQFNDHFSQPGASTFFLLARDNYLQLKKMNNHNLSTQVHRHQNVAATEFAALPSAVTQKHEALTKTINELENIAHSYSHIADIYKSVAALELEALERLGGMLKPGDLVTPKFKTMQDANDNVISLLERFKTLAYDEIDRLLIKLEDFSAPAQPQTRIKPVPGKKKKPEKAAPKTVLPVAPKNRVDIRTQDDKILSGKPRSDNPGVVDILDSHGQRKATYLLSSDGESWLEYTENQTSSTAASPSSGPTWAPYDTTVQKLLGEIQHSESVADYLGRKKDSTPSAPEGLLTYQANRLDEHIREIGDLLPQLASADDRQLAQDSLTQMRERSRTLREKGQALRVDLIISNNAPIANDLQYLADSRNLQVRRTRQERLPMERASSSRQQPPRDYIDEFELKIKDRDQVWAYAHLHYAEPASDALAFSAAHLKRPEQRFQGAQLQSQEAQSGRRYEIHRGALMKGHVQDIILSGQFDEQP